MRRVKPANWCKDCAKGTELAACKLKGHTLGRRRTNYMYGRDFEYRIMRNLTNLGCLCFRRYGSKGVFDIVAVPPLNAEDPRAMVIQAKKKDYVHPDEMSRIIDLGKRLNARVMVATRSKENALIFRQLLN